MSTETTRGVPRADIVSGKVDDAINEAVGDIWPGAHVVITQYNRVAETWSYTISFPDVEIEATEELRLEEVIDRAERAVTDAKAKLLTAWGVPS